LLVSNEFKSVVREQAMDIELRARLARDSHFTAARRWDSINLYLGLLAAGTGVIGGAVAGLFLQNLILASIVATTSGLLAAIITFLKPSERIDLHKRAGDNWAILRDRVASFHKLEIEHIGNEEEIQRGYDKLLSTKEEVTKASPIIPTWAYDQSKSLLQRRQSSKNEK